MLVATNTRANVGNRCGNVFPPVSRPIGPQPAVPLATDHELQLRIIIFIVSHSGRYSGSALLLCLLARGSPDTDSIVFYPKTYGRRHMMP